MTLDPALVTEWDNFVQGTGGMVVAWPFVDDAHAGDTAGQWPVAVWRQASQAGNLPVSGDGVRSAPDGATVYVTPGAVVAMTTDPTMRVAAPFSMFSGSTFLFVVAMILAGVAWYQSQAKPGQFDDVF